MKVTLDLTKLLHEGKISKQEHDKLADLSKGETKNHAFAVVLVLAAVSIVIGTVGLFPDFFENIAKTLLDIFGARGLHFVGIVVTATGAFIGGKRIPLDVMRFPYAHVSWQCRYLL